MALDQRLGKLWGSNYQYHIQPTQGYRLLIAVLVINYDFDTYRHHRIQLQYVCLTQLYRKHIKLRNKVNFQPLTIK